MKFLNEEVTDTIRLTNHQKAILATIANSDGGVADDILASSNNLSGALQQLTKMKMVVNSEDDKYTATGLGNKYALEASIVDETGAVTEEGQKLVIGATKKTTDVPAEEPIKESIGSFKDYLSLI